jgi:Rrf2 family protein
VEYGLHCLLYLVSSPGQTVDASARELADLQGVSAEYLAKVFTKLHRAGLVAGTEGTGGGFALARAPEKITVLDVVVAIDGKKRLFECRNIRVGCAIFGSNPPQWATQGVCAIHAVMLEAEERMRAVLAATSLADLTKRVTAKAPGAFAGDIANWLAERSADRRGAAPQSRLHGRRRSL